MKSIKIFALITIMAVIMGFSAIANAAVGDIQITVQDELSNTLDSGAAISFDLRVPGNVVGNDTGLDDIDTVYTITDNGANDNDPANGVILVPNTLLSGQIDDTEPYRVENVEVDGYVTWTSTNQAYSSAANPNTLATVNKFTLKVVVTRQVPISTALNGATVAVTDGLTAVDGGANDSDTLANGTLYIAQSPPGAAKNIAITATGFISDSDNQDINALSQTVINSALDYPLVITAIDQFDNTIALTQTNSSIGPGGTFTTVEKVDNLNTLYVAATGGPGTLTLSVNGYVDSNSTSGAIDLSSGQTTLAYDGITGGKLNWLLKVGTLNDQFSNALTQDAGHSVVVYTDSGCTTAATNANEYFDAGTTAFYARPENGNVAYYLKYNMGATSGYAASCSAAQTPDSTTAQELIVFDGATDGLPWILKVATLKDVFGNNITQDNVNHSIELYNDACTTLATGAATYFDGTSWYAKATDGDITYYVKYLPGAGTGYVNTCEGGTAADSASGQQLVQFTGTDGLPWLLKVGTLEDQFANPLTQATTDTVAFYTDNTCTTGVTNGVAYFDTGTTTWYSKAEDGDTTYYAKYARDGYVDECNTTGVAATSAAQASVNMAQASGFGLDWLIQVNDVDDELANNIIQANSDVVSVYTNDTCAAAATGDAPITYFDSGSGKWYARPADGQAATYHVKYSRAGYVDKCNGSGGGVVANGTTAQAQINFNGGTGFAIEWLFEVGTLENISGATITQSATHTVNIYTNDTCTTLATNALASFATSTWHLKATDGDTSYYIKYYAGASGYAAQCSDVETSTSTTAQVTVNFQTTDYIPHVLKIASIEDQFGNVLSTDGTETVTVFTNAACDAAATNDGAIYAVGAWYMKPEDGNVDYYVKYSKGAASGYVDQCSDAFAVVDTDGQTEVSFSGTTGLKWLLKTGTIEDQFGTAITQADGTTDSFIVYKTACSAGNEATLADEYFDTVSGKWYAKPTDGDAADYYISYGKPGYVTTCSGAIALAQAAQATVNMAAALDWSIQIGTVQDELGNAIVQDSGHVINVYTGSCGGVDATNPENKFSGGSWYAKPENADGTFYVKYSAGVGSGYIDTCETAGELIDTTLATGAQKVVDFTVADSDGLPWQLKVTTLNDQFGGAITQLGAASHQPVLYINPACNVAATNAATQHDGTNWFLRAEDGNIQYYVKYTFQDTTGYIDRCETTGAQPDSTDTAAGQAAVEFDVADEISWMIAVDTLNNQFAEAITQADDGYEAVTAYVGPGCAGGSEAADGTAVFDSDYGKWFIKPTDGGAQAISLKYRKKGYADRCHSTTQNTTSTAQMSYDFTGADAMDYMFTAGAIQDQFGDAITKDSGDTLEFYSDAGCTAGNISTTANVRFSGGTWYAKPEEGNAAATNYYIKYKKAGYVDTCGGDVFNPDAENGNVATVTLLQAGASGGLDWLLKAGALEDQFGTSILPQVTGDDFAVYTDSGCSAPATGAGEFFDDVTPTNVWYAHPTDGNTATYYVKYGRAGYVDECMSVTATGDTAQKLADFDDATTNGLDWLIKVTSLEDQFGNGLTQYASDTVLVYTDSGCTAVASNPSEFFDDPGTTNTLMWYAKPDNGLATYYVKYSVGETTGYVDKCAALSGVVDTAVNTIDFTGANGVDWLIKAGTIQDQFGTALTQAAADTVSVYKDSGCTTGATNPDVYFDGSSFYAKPESGNRTYYVSYLKNGYITECQAAGVAVTNAAQGTIDFLGAATYGLDYMLKVQTLEDELGNVLIQTGGDSVAVYTDSTCTTAATNAGVKFDAGTTAWYAKPENGDFSADGITYYVKYSLGSTSGYIDQCEVDGGQPDKTGTQTQVAFDNAQTDGLKWLIKVGNLYDQFGNALGVQDNVNQSATLFTDSACTAAATNPNWTFDGVSTAWYARPQDGDNASNSVTYYIKYSMGATSGYVVQCEEDGAVTNSTDSATGQAVVDFGTNATSDTDGFDWLLRIDAVEDEFASSITQNGITHSVVLHDNNTCTSVDGGATTYFDSVSGKWYARTTSGDATYYLKYDAGTTSGYVASCEDGTATLYTNAQAAASFATTDGMKWFLKVNVLQDQFGTPVNQVSGDTVNVYTDSACTVNGTAMTFNTTAWYGKPVNGDFTNDAVTYYVLYSKGDGSGYIDRCEVAGAQVNSDTVDGQINVELSSVGGDGLNWLVRVDSIADQFGNGLTQVIGDSVTFYSGTGCSAAATNPNAYFDAITTKWYARPTDGDGTYSIKYGKGAASGYTNTCSEDIVIDSTFSTGGVQGAQVFTGANDGLLWKVKVTTLNDEFGSALTQAAAHTVTVYSDAGCVTPATNAAEYFDIATATSIWYAKPEDGDQNYYVKYSLGATSGYVDTCETAGANASVTTVGTALFDGAAADGIDWLLKVVTLEDQFDTALTASDSLDTVTFWTANDCTGATTAPTVYFDSASSAWYARPTDGNITYYSKIVRKGYADVCQATGVAADSTTAQQVIPFDNSGADYRLPYLLKVTDFYDQFGNALTQALGHTVGVYTDADCTTTATNGAAYFDAGTTAWYAKPEDGQAGATNYYLKYSLGTTSGYIDQCEASGVTPDSSVGQTAVNYGDVAAGTAADGFQWMLKVANVYDQFGNAITQEAADTVELFTDSACSAAATNDAFYFDGAATTNTGLWYAKPEDGDTNDSKTYYVKYNAGATSGYVVECENTGASPDTTAQANTTDADGGLVAVDFGIAATADDDGLDWLLKVSSITDQFDYALTQANDGSQALNLYTTADCTTTAATGANWNFDNDTSAWYARPQDGNETYYTHYTMGANSGYVDVCEEGTLADHTTAQQNIIFSSAGTDDRFPWLLKVGTVNDQFTTAFTQTTNDVIELYNADNTCAAGNVVALTDNGDPSGTIYFDGTNWYMRPTTGDVTYNVKFYRDGYVPVCEQDGAAGAHATAQAVADFTAAGTDDSIPFNVKFRVLPYGGVLGTDEITGLQTLNLYASGAVNTSCGSSSDRVCPIDFMDNVATDFYYYGAFTADVAMATMLIKDVDDDPDDYTDYRDSDSATCVPADETWPTAGATICEVAATPGRIELVRLVDYVTVQTSAGLDTDSYIDAGGYEEITIQLLDDNGGTYPGNLVAGDDDYNLIDIALSGPGTTKTFVLSTDANTTLRHTCQTIVTETATLISGCKPDGGSVTVYINDTFADSNPLVVSVTKSVDEFPQQSHDNVAANTYVRPIVVDSFTLSFTTPQTNDVTFTAGTITAYDQYNNIVNGLNGGADFDASTDNLTISHNSTGTVLFETGGAGSSATLSSAADFASGIADVNTLGLKYTGTSGNVTFSVVAAVSAATGSTTININPGAVTQFDWSLTSPQRAGVALTGTNKITAKDISGNIATTFDASGANNVTITANSLGGTVKGLGSAGTNVLDQSTDFVNGVADLSALGMYYEVVSDLAGDGSTTETFTATKGFVVNTSSAIGIKPGPVFDFIVALADQQNAVAFTGVNTITARDRYTNIVKDYDAQGTNVTITNDGGGTVTGTGLAAPGNVIEASTFVDGLFDLTGGGMTYTGTSGASIAFTFTSGDSKVGTATIQIDPGLIDHFALELPTTVDNNVVMTGAQITAQDVSNNTITDYDTRVTTANVTISTDAGGVFGLDSNNIVLKTDFVSGIADLELIGMKYQGPAQLVVFTASDGSSHEGTDNVTITPGELDHFVWTMASAQRNLVPFTGVNTIEAQDISNNTITDYDTQGYDVTITSSLGGTVIDLSVTDGLLEKTSFSNGIANLTGLGAYLDITYNLSAAGDNTTFTAAVAAPAVNTVSGNVAITPGPVESFLVTLTDQQNAVAFTGGTVTALDGNTNVVKDYDTYGTTVTITTDGGGTLTPGNTVAKTVFVEGIYDLTSNLTYTGATGTVAFTFTSGDGKTGSDSIVIEPGVLDHWNVVIADQQNGYPFVAQSYLEAVDISGNLITNYDASVNNVVMTSTAASYSITGLGSGSSNILDQASDVNDGIAWLHDLGMMYTGVSGSITFIATGGGKTGQTTASVGVAAGDIESFVVQATPTSLTVNQSTTIKITAIDAQGNVVTTYSNPSGINIDTSFNNQQGSLVTFTGDVTGAAINEGYGAAQTGAYLVDGSEFVNGTATIYLTSNYAQSNIEIRVAEIANELAEGKTSDAISNTNCTWAPGDLDHIYVTTISATTLTVDDDPIGANAATIEVTVYDAFNNEIPNYRFTNPYEVTHNGLATGTQIYWDNTVAIGETGGTNGNTAYIYDSPTTFDASGTLQFKMSSTLSMNNVTITVTDPNIPVTIGNNAATAITWQPDVASELRISGVPDPITHGIGSTVVVTAYDEFGNVASGYNDQVTFQSTEAYVVPAPLTLVSGTATTPDTVQFNTIGTGTLNVYDTDASPDVTGSVTVGVVHGDTTQLVIVKPTTQAVAGTAYSITVQALDAFNQLATGDDLTYFTIDVSKDKDGNTSHATIESISQGQIISGQGTAKPIIRVTDGEAIFTVKDQKAEELSVKFDATGSISESSLDITSNRNLIIVPAAISALQVVLPGETAAPDTYDNKGKTTDTPTTQIAGVEFALEVNAVDQYYNVVYTDASTVALTSDDTLCATESCYPANFDLASGTYMLSADLISLYSATSTVITASTVGTPSYTGTATVTVQGNPDLNNVDLIATTPVAATDGNYTVYSNSEGNIVLKFETTSEVDMLQMHSADGVTTIPVEVYIYDEWGNPVPNASVILVYNSRTDLSGNSRVANATVNVSSTTSTDATGKAVMYITTDEEGNYLFTAYYSSQDAANIVGISEFRITFRAADRTAPSMTIQSSDSANVSVADNDVFEVGEAVSIEFRVDDDQGDTSGIDESSLKIIVDDTDLNAPISASRAVLASAPSACTYTMVSAGVMTGTCTWDSTNYSVGYHYVTIQVSDNDGNTETTTIRIKLVSGFVFDRLRVMPNPVRLPGETFITFQSSRGSTGMVTIEIYTSTGRFVRSLTAMAQAGYNEIRWDGRDQSGSIVASDIYFYRLIGSFSGQNVESTGKIAVIK